MVALKRGDLERAERFTDDALTWLREAGDTWSIAETYVIAADTARLRGDVPRATVLYAQALAAFWGQGDRRASSSTIDGVAAIAASRGLAEPAARLVGGVVAFRAANLPPNVTTASMPPAARQAKSEARRMLGDVAFERAWAAGQELTLDEVVVEATAITDTLIAESASPETRAEAYPSGLSKREVEVLHLLGTGLTNVEIGDRLFLSEHTIRAHLRRIYHKLDITTRAEAVRFTMEHHLA